MISVASTLVLISLVFGSIPEVWAAPIGSREMHVHALRGLAEQEQSMPLARRDHHSATSIVPRFPAPVEARDGAPADLRNSNKERSRRSVKHEKRDPTPKALPRFKRDIARRGKVEEASSSHVARQEENNDNDNENDDNQNGGGNGNGKCSRRHRHKCGCGSGGSEPSSTETGSGTEPTETSTETSSVEASPTTPTGPTETGSGTEPTETSTETSSDEVTPTTPAGPTETDAENAQRRSFKRRHHYASPTPTPEPQVVKREVTEPKRIVKRSAGPIKPIAMFRRALAIDRLD